MKPIKPTKYVMLVVNGLDAYGDQMLANNFAETTVTGNAVRCVITCKEQHAETIAGKLIDWGLPVERRGIPFTKGAAK